MDVKGGTDKMRISIRGSDKGSATLMAMSLIIILSFVLLSIVPRVINMRQTAGLYKAKVLSEIGDSNKELVINSDLY
jgi:hypothetical protein